MVSFQLRVGEFFVSSSFGCEALVALCLYALWLFCLLLIHSALIYHKKKKKLKFVLDPYCRFLLISPLHALITPHQLFTLYVGKLSP